jgi:hypothetical protein
VGPLTDFWLKAVSVKSSTSGGSLTDAGAAQFWRSDLTRTIEREVIPRLLLAHESDPPRAARPQGAATEATATDPVAELARLALEREVSDLVAFVEGLRIGDQGIDVIFQQFVAPASRLIGDLWKMDHCDFAAFSGGLSRLQQLLVELDPEAVQQTRH